MIEVKYRAEQKFSPIAKDVLKVAAKRVFGDEPVRLTKAGAKDEKYINFGGRGGIRCLSPAQIKTAANAVSAVERSFTLYRDGVNLSEFYYHVVDPGMFWEYAATLASLYAQPIAVDIENAPDKRVLSIAIATAAGAFVFPEEFCQGAYLKEIVQALSGNYYIIGANWKYDQGVLFDHTGIMVPVWFDTMLAHHSLHPAATGQHGLKQMAESFFGVPDWDKDLEQYTGKGKNKDFSKIPRDVLYKYNAYDVYYTYHLYEDMLPLVEDHNAFWTETHWANAFAYVEANRVAIDVDYVVNLREKLVTRENELRSVLPEGLNPNSPKQLKELLGKKLGKVLASTDAKTLETLKNDSRVSDIVVPLLEYRKVVKQRSTYCDAYLRFEQGGLIRPTFNIHTTATGRLSGSDPNVTNVPRDKTIRGVFVARSEDRVLVEADYGQAELRAQAVLSGDPDLIAAFQPDSPDFFDGLMPRMFPHEFPTLEDYLRYETEKCGGDEKDYRAKAKGVIYGLSFARGARAIGEALNMSGEDAQAIINNFMGSYPVYAKWRTGVLQAAVNPEESITGWWGLSFEAEVVTDRNRAAVQRSALSFLPQNTVVGLGATAIQRLVNYFRLHPELDAKIVMFIHDAGYVDCPREVADEVGALVSSTMMEVGREVFGDEVLFTADASYSYRWGVHD